MPRTKPSATPARFSLCALSGALMLLAGSAGAATERVAAAPTEPQVAVLENTRRNARVAAEWLARSVDGWFGNTDFEDHGKVTDGRLSVGVFKRSDQSADIDVRFNARFHLPNLENRAYVFIGRDDQRNVVRDTPEAFARQQQLLAGGAQDRSFLAGLGVTLADVVDFRLGFRSRLQPYVQARYSRPWTLSPGQVIEFRETVFWTRRERLGSTTALSYGLALSPSLALRWLNAATITEVSKTFEWSSTLGLYAVLGEQRLLSLEALVNGDSGDGLGVGLSDRGLLAKWEQPIYKDWLLGEVSVGHFWPRPDSNSPRGRAWAVGGALKMRF